MKVVADTLGVARSNLIDRLAGRTKPRRRYHKAQDAAVVPMITALVAARPTYGYRRISPDHGDPEPAAALRRCRGGQPQARLPDLS